MPVGRSWTNNPRLAIADEHLSAAIAARHEVRGVRAEGDEAPLRRERRARAWPIALDAARTDAQPLD